MGLSNVSLSVLLHFSFILLHISKATLLAFVRACFCHRKECSMDPNDRPVHVRTSASARDFWSKVRDESEVSPKKKST